MMIKPYNNKTILLIVLFFTSIANIANSQDLIVQIGTGTSNTEYTDAGPTPFGMYYQDDRTQILFTGDELKAVGLKAGLIKSISFQVDNGSNQVMNSFKVRIKPVTQESLTGIVDMAGSTTCFNSTYVTAVKQWNTITFSTPFVWDGNFNILVDISFDNTGISICSKVSYTSTPLYMVWSVYSNSSLGAGESMTGGSGSYCRPNVKLSEFIPTTDPSRPPDLTLTGKATPTLGRNYIQTIFPITPNGDGGATLEEVTYYDGLGRPQQSVSVGASPTGGDIVQPILYDNFGRAARKYLPYATGVSMLGAFQSNAVDAAYSNSCDHYKFYNTENNSVAHDASPYSQTVFDGSPLNRIVEQGAFGAVWQPNLGHTQRINYGTNAVGSVRSLMVDGSENLVVGNFLPSGELYKTVTYNENWTSGNLNSTEEYKDKLGQLVLKRNYVKNVDESISEVNTYYIYDVYGLLRYVLPPNYTASLANTSQLMGGDGATVVLNTTELSNPSSSRYELASGATLTLKPGFVGLAGFSATQERSTESLDVQAYYYAYDSRKRMIVKKLPGADPIYMAYDSRDRLVASQDGEQRKIGKWLFIRYDALNRPTVTGLIAFTTSYTSANALQIAICSAYSGATPRDYGEDLSENVNTLYYTEKSFPTSADGSVEYLTATYYDNYGSWQVAFNEANSISGYGDGLGNSYSKAVVGQAIGSAVKVLGENTYLYSTTYYDRLGRPVQLCRQLYAGGTETVSSKYEYPDFGNRLVQDRTVQTVNGTTHNVDRYYSYDQMNRLLKVEQWVAGDAAGRIVVAENAYNELGQLKYKQLGENLQQVDYSYNIRGWLTNINNPTSPGKDLFAQRLLYNGLVAGINDNMAQYNGNISGTMWYSGATQSYGFCYDELDRLTAADYKVYTDAWNNTSSYEERGIQYDLNGNIKALSRSNSSGTVTSLAYTYIGNQLTRVTGIGNGHPYQYDGNGNAIKDGCNSFEIEYNELNLPKTVSKTDVLKYTYTATGEKVKVDINGIPQNYYCDGFVYKGDKTLDYIIHPEGLSKRGSRSYIHYYYLKDHLGNVRTSFYKGTGGTAVADQKTDYYPFGKSFDNVATNNNRYLYNGKEVQDQSIGGTAFGWYDYGARFYDPELGRFHTQDRFAEKYLSLTPYQYGANNPVLYVDINGDSLNVAQRDAQQMVTNTLTKDDVSYIQFDKNGNVNLDLLLSHKSESGNYNALVEIASSDILTKVTLNDNYEYMNNDGKKDSKDMSYIKYDSNCVDKDGSKPNSTTTGEAGEMGMTLLPGKGTSGRNSQDNSITVVINKNLSEPARSEMYSHEANGHARMYIRTRSRSESGHKFVGLTDTNQPLKTMIITSKMETVKNMKR